MSENIKCGITEAFDLLWHDRRFDGSLQLTPFGMKILERLEVEFIELDLHEFIPNAAFRIILGRRAKGPWFIAKKILHLSHEDDIFELGMYSTNFQDYVDAYKD